MYKKLIAAVAMVVSSVAAHADPLYYSFEWKGFEAQPSGSAPLWLPDYTLSGYFRGEDVNSDNIISSYEIKGFYLHDTSWHGGTEFLGGCPSRFDADGVTGCSLNAFSYDIANKALTFSARAEWTFGASIYSYLGWSSTGVFNYGNDGPSPGSWRAIQTADTQFTITSAVPEPATWAMLAGGLLVAGAAARRRARAG